MITVTDLSIGFDGQTLFSNVNLKFTAGNCYGIIGANGAGKSTFLRILSGELEPTKGEVVRDPKTRMSVLRQDHFAFDQYSVLDTIIMGNPRLYQVMKEKDALYAKPDFSDEDGIRVSELEGEFAEMGGWDAETDAAKLLGGLGLGSELLESQMSALTGAEKVKVMLGGRPLRPAGHYPSGRAHQRPGHPVDQLAGGLPTGLPRHGAGGLPRPPLPQQRVYPHGGCGLQQDQDLCG